MKKIKIMILSVCVLFAAGLYADCRFYRYSDSRQICYTADRYIHDYQNSRKIYYLEDDKYICRYSDNRKIYYLEDGKYICRYSDGRKLYYFDEYGYICRYSDSRKLYRISDKKIYRYSDNRQLYYYEGFEKKFLIFMMLAINEF